MASTATTSASVIYTPPLGSPNSGSATFQTASAYNAQNIGTMDIPAGTLPGTLFPVPFGTVNSAKVLIVKNNTTDEVGFRMNGAGADIFRLVANGVFHIEMPASPTLNPIVDATIVILVSPSVMQSANYFVFGD
jgi:hypothetical protein